MASHTKLPLLRTILAAAAALLIAVVQPAYASEDVKLVLTSDANPGGGASFKEVIAGHFTLTACDRQKGDGHGAVAYASFHRWGFQNRVADLNGGGNGCASRDVRIDFSNFGRPVYVTVCLNKTGNRFCRYRVGRA
jgi:hypothetical protein